MRHRPGLPSALATLLAMLGGLRLVAGALALVVPAFIEQFDELQRSADEGLDEAVRWLTQTFGIRRGELDDAVDAAIARVQENSGTIAGGVLSGATIAAEAVATFLLVVVLVFLFVHDGRAMRSFTVGLFPARHPRDVDAIGEKIRPSVSG